MHDRAREVNWQIADDHADLPNFAQASQNITVAVAVLAALPEPTMLEERREHDKLHICLERAMQQQALVAWVWSRECHYQPGVVRHSSALEGVGQEMSCGLYRRPQA